MNQNKYRETLQNRTIKPSVDSWEKLNGKLTSHEKKQKGSNWMFLKVASVILVFISVGFYFWQENEKISHPVEIASPAEIENLNNVPEIEDTHNTEIVVTPENSATSDEPAIDPVIKEVATTEVAAIETKNENSFSKEIPQPADIDSLAEEILLTETTNSREQNIDDEVEQLLKDSKIRLIVDGQISSKKVVDAHTLLNSVEEDLYKDLKQKLIEKITNSLKNPKEVVTSREK